MEPTHLTLAVNRMQQPMPPSRQLIPIQPENLLAVWPEVKAGLEEIIARNPDDWIPEDVYLMVKTSFAVLYTAYVGNEYAGFVLLRAEPAEKALHIWACHNASRHDMLGIFRDDLEAMARKVGAARLTFNGMRPGWERHALKYGFRVRHVVYEREV